MLKTTIAALAVVVAFAAAPANASDASTQIAGVQNAAATSQLTDGFRGKRFRKFRKGAHFKFRKHRGHVKFKFKRAHSCHGLKKKAHYTGKKYWWNRYYSCIGRYH